MRRIIGMCMAAVLMLTACGNTAADEQVPELIEAVGVDMDTAKVVKMDLSGIASYSAQIVPKIEEISFLASGSINELSVSIGDHVKKGQLLATLSGASGRVKSLREEIKNMKAANDDVNKQASYDIEMQEEQVKNLEKRVKKAKTSSERKRLKEQILLENEDIKISKEKLKQQKELQQLELRQKQEELTELSKDAKNSRLYSPINGEVVGTTGGTGYMVQGGGTAVQVANMDVPRIKTQYIPGTRLAKASSYVVEVDGKEYEVEVEEQVLDREDVERGVYPQNTWFDFVDENVPAKVGKSATLNLYTDSVKDALVVPANALFQNGEESYVYVVNGDARTKVTVTTGTKTDAYVQLETGVKEGDVVYVEG